MRLENAIEKLTHDNEEGHECCGDHGVGTVHIKLVFQQIINGPLNSPHSSNPLTPRRSKQEEKEKHQETIPRRKAERQANKEIV